MLWYNVVFIDMTWHGMTAMIWYNMTWYDMTWYNMIW